MLVEAKVKVKQLIEGKPRIRNIVYVVEAEFFSNAEYSVTSILSRQNSEGDIEDFEFISLKVSSIKEIDEQSLSSDGTSYMAVFRGTFVDDNGREKHLRYKVLLWADSLSGALNRAHNIQRQGYDLEVESVKEVNYIYIQPNQND